MEEESNLLLIGKLWVMQIFQQKLILASLLLS